MSDFKDLLEEITGAAADQIKTELIDYYDQAKKEQYLFARDTADKVEKWIRLRALGEIDNEELSALLEARKRVVLQNINTVEIESRARLEKILFGIIDTVTNKLIDKII